MEVKLLQETRRINMFCEMFWLHLFQFVLFCYQGLRIGRAVQCPPSPIVRREVRWWREAQQTNATTSERAFSSALSFSYFRQYGLAWYRGI